MSSDERKEAVLAALHQAVKHELSAEEMRRQRVSFVMSMVKGDSMTRQAVQDAVDKQDGLVPAGL